MTPYVDDPDFKLYLGDVRDVLRDLPEGSVDCCVTSPPYWNQRDYKVEGQIGLEPTPDLYVKEMVAVFRELWRVLRDDGTLWLNIGDSYAANRSYQVTDSKHTDVGNAMSSRVPTGLKPKDLVGIPWMLAFALRADGWYLRSEIVWCLGGGTRLYAKTAKGEGTATVHELVRLDPKTVELWNGERWTRVVSWHQSSNRGEPLEVVLASGERISCTPGHVWPTDGGNKRTDALVPGDVIKTVVLPEPEAPDDPRFLPDNDVGWFIGRYLADGSMSQDTVQISCHAKEIDGLFAKAEVVARALHGSAAAHRTGDNQGTVNLNGPLIAPLIKTYVNGSSAKTKHLTQRAWRRRNGFLHALLIGYLSGDGHYDVANDRWRLGFTRNDRLADDFRTIAARLGLQLRLAPSTTTGFGGRYPTYRGQIRLRQTSHWNARKDGEVVEVRRSRGRKFWDIEVEDDPHLFSLASGVLTHNSKPNPMPESILDRPTCAHEKVFLFAKQRRYFYDKEAVTEPAEWRRWGDQTNVKYNEKNTGKAGFIKDRSKKRIYEHINTAGTQEGMTKNLRNVWTIMTQPFPEAHFAVFPEALVEPCIKAGCPAQVCVTCDVIRTRIVETDNGWEHEGQNDRGFPYDHRGTGTPQSSESLHRNGGGVFSSARTVGWTDCGHNNYRPGVVLDPFSGAATTAVVARRLGRHAVGIELSEEYAKIAARRLSQQSLLA